MIALKRKLDTISFMRNRLHFIPNPLSLPHCFHATVHMNGTTFPSSFRREEFQPYQSELILSRLKSQRLQQRARILVYKCRRYKYRYIRYIYISIDRQRKPSSTSSSYGVLYIVRTTCSIATSSQTHVETFVWARIYLPHWWSIGVGFSYTFACLRGLPQWFRSPIRLTVVNQMLRLPVVVIVDIDVANDLWVACSGPSRTRFYTPLSHCYW